MQSRFLRSLTAATLAVGLSGAVSAQIICYESLLGSSVGIGDDSVLAMQPIGFAFPFNGTTYTHIHPVTNGFVYLSNAGAPAPGGALCCTGTTANLVAGSPKICVRFDDLNLTAANSAGVYVNQMANKCVITWVNAVEFGNTVRFTVQMQLYSTGEIVFFYDGNVTARTAGDALVGMSEGGGAAVPVASDLSAGGASATTTLFQTFNNGASPWDLAGNSVLFIPAGLGYVFAMQGCAALHESYGSGCYNIPGSVYESFPANTFDLSGQTVTMTPAGATYLWQAAPISTFFTTTTNLALTDDSVSAAIPLASPFPYPGGAATSVVVASNGRVFLGTTGNAAFANSVAAFLADPTSYGMWYDFNPAAGGTVESDYDAINNQQVITWNGVVGFGTTTPNTWQVVLSCNGSAAPGQVELRFQSFTNNSSTNTSLAIVGYSVGATARDPGNRDLSTLFPFLAPAETPALNLSGNPIPLLGSTVTYTLSNIPANALASAHILSLSQIAPPGFDMTVYGAPGCWQHIGLAGSDTTLVFGTGTQSRTVTMPTGASWQGFNVYSQAASLVPGANLLQVITSNGLRSQLF